MPKKAVRRISRLALRAYLGDEVELVDIMQALDAGKMTVKNVTKGIECTVLAEYSDYEKMLLKAGGKNKFHEKVKDVNFRRGRDNMDVNNRFNAIIEQQLKRVEALKNAPAPVDFAKLEKVKIGFVDGDGVGPIITDSCRKVLGELLKNSKIGRAHV